MCASDSITHENSAKKIKIVAHIVKKMSVPIIFDIMNSYDFLREKIIHCGWHVFEDLIDIFFFESNFFFL